MTKVLLLRGLLAAAGVFSLFCAWRDYDWFMESRRARFFVRIFGRKGARIFYILLGFAVMIMGVLIPIDDVS